MAAHLGDVAADAIARTSAVELLRWQLALIAGDEPAGASYIECRCLPQPGAPRAWEDARWAAEQGAEGLLALGERAEVYVGAALRHRMGGGTEDVRHGWCLWADLDTPDALRALDGFTPAPTLLVETSPGRAQAWWRVREPVPADDLVRLNRRLQHRLGGDPRAVDAARILRPVGVRNVKRGCRTRCLALNLAARAPLADEVVADAPPPPVVVPAPRTPRRSTATPADYDALRAIPAGEYIPALTGRELSPSGKVRCPLHGGGAERTPSLHVYDDGWACFGRCEPRAGRDHAGGDIFEFGARLYGIDPHGRGFHDIARRLTHDLGVEP